jgi:hypothetical protein
LRGVFKGLNSPFSEILNKNTKPDKVSVHQLKITFEPLNFVRKAFLSVGKKTLVAKDLPT